MTSEITDVKEKGEVDGQKEQIINLMNEHNCDENGGIISKLNIEDWEPKKQPNNALTNSRNENCNSPKRTLDKRKLPYEEIIQLLQEKIEVLLKRTDFTTGETRADLKFVQRQTRYNPDVVLNRRIVEKIVKFGIAHVFLRAWECINTTDYLSPEKDIVFKNLQTILSVIWNCTDKSPQLCDSLIRCGVVQLFTSELKTEKLACFDLTENSLYLVKAYLGILHNLLRHCHDSRKIFRAANAVDVLQLYISARQGLVKTKAYIILSCIIDEHENELINSDEQNIAFIVEILKEALSSENHFSKTFAFWASEIVSGLNHLAINDNNKSRIGRLGALSLYMKLLSSHDADEQGLAAAGLWILSFHDENKRRLRDLPDCLDVLEKLANDCSQENVRRSARGTLWVIKAGPATPQNIQPAEEEIQCDAPHVMVSYHWGQQPIMLLVAERLKQAGYKVWMDIDNMSGSTLEAMALAVERSAVVIVCMSQGYKDSPSCRTEAEYTYRLRKDIIPLLLQPGYDPDGWLGIMVGTRLYFDFTTAENIPTQMPRLLREIGTRGSINKRPALSVRSAPSSESFLEGSASSQQLSSILSTCSMHSYGRSNTDISSWTNEDIRSWLDKHNVSHLASRLAEWDGELLLQYKKMLRDAPPFFYHTLETMLKLDLVSILRFTKMLEEIA